MPLKSFRDLTVWQRAMELTYAIYAATSEFPKSEIFALVQQMRRAAVSISSNIAEGHARHTNVSSGSFSASPVAASPSCKRSSSSPEACNTPPPSSWTAATPWQASFKECSPL